MSLYDGATGAERWERSLSLIGEASSAKTIVLFSQREGHGESFLGAVGIEQLVVERYRAHYAARNVLMTEGARLHTPGLVRTTETICRREVLLRSEFYNDFMRAQDIRYSMAVTALRAPDCAIHLGVFRPHGAPPYNDADTPLFSELFPHLRTAMQVHRRLGEREQRAGALQEVVDHLGRGVAFVDAAGSFVYMNAVLEQIFETRDGLLLARDGISASTGAAARELRLALSKATLGGAGSTVAVPRPSGKPPYSVLVSPVLKRLLFLGRFQASAFLVVSDPCSQPTTDLLTLQRAFGLTPAEARVAWRLASGSTLRHIAAELNISIHTARTHLKRALAKTGSNRQSELVRRILMLGSAPGRRPLPNS